MENQERDKRRQGLIDGRWLWPMGRKEQKSRSPLRVEAVSYGGLGEMRGRLHWTFWLWEEQCYLLHGVFRGGFSAWIRGGEYEFKVGPADQSLVSLGVTLDLPSLKCKTSPQETLAFPTPYSISAVLPSGSPDALSLLSMPGI